MSLEQQIETLNGNIVKLITSLGAKPAAAAAGKAEGATGTEEKRGRGRPAGTTKAAPATDDDDLGGDDLGGDDDLDLDGGVEEEQAYTFDDLKKLMVSLRDVNGKDTGKDACRDILKKFKLANFADMQNNEDRYNEFADAVKKAVAAKKGKK